MKKLLLTLILILAALVAVGFLPGPDAAVQAISMDGPTLPGATLSEPAATTSADNTAFSASPVVQIVVGLTGTLFGILTFLPLLGKEDYRATDGRNTCSGANKRP